MQCHRSGAQLRAQIAVDRINDTHIKDNVVVKCWAQITLTEMKPTFTASQLLLEEYGICIK